MYKKSDDGSVTRMFYHNRFNRGWFLVIAWKNMDGKESYKAFKYSSSSEKPVFEVDGVGDWDRFFAQLTIIGLLTGEPCEISAMTDAPRAPEQLGKSIEGKEEHGQNSQRRHLQ